MYVTERELYPEAGRGRGPQLRLVRVPRPARVLPLLLIPSPTAQTARGNARLPRSLPVFDERVGVARARGSSAVRKISRHFPQRIQLATRIERED